MSIAEGPHVRVWLGNAASESDTAYDIIQNLGEGESHEREIGRSFAGQQLISCRQQTLQALVAASEYVLA